METDPVDDTGRPKTLRSKQNYMHLKTLHKAKSIRRASLKRHQQNFNLDS